MKKKTFVFFTIGVLLTTYVNCQVTIGSAIKPNAGSLLDLKEYDPVTIGGATSYKGLLLPRVELHDEKKLKLGTAEEILSDEYEQHTGLIVYNTSELAPFCLGVYVWTGEEWKRLQKECPTSGLTVSPSSDLYFLSGQNGSVITPASLNIEWDPATATVNWSTANNSINFTANPNTPWTITPQNNVLFTPDVMTADEVDQNGGNPFLIKTNELIFRADNDGVISERRIKVNQINKAIILDTYTYDKLEPDAGESSTTRNYTNTIKSNAKWRLASIEPNDATNAVSNLELDGNALGINSEIDWEYNNGANGGSANNLKYDVVIGDSKSRYSKITLEDASSSKRFDDVIISFYQCTNIGVNPSMSDWAVIAGFLGVKEPEDRNTSQQISEQEDIAAGIDVPNPLTGVAWHRDQDGNIFLSGHFGYDDAPANTKERRWMITNLEAKNFAPLPRTGDDNAINLSMPADPMVNPVTNSPYWIYPNGGADGTSSATYDTNPRAGILYNFNAASNGKPYSGVVENTAYNGHDRRQGICPNGWHLPSDWEFNALENEISAKTSIYSTTPDMGEVFDTNGSLTGGASFALNNLAIPMKEQCERSGVVSGNAGTKGTSNPIDKVIASGTNYLMSGYGTNTGTVGYGSFGYLFTSSYNTSATFIIARNFNATTSDVFRVTSQAVRYFSVRCKKDN